MQGKRILLAAVGGLTVLSLTTSAFAIMSVPTGWYLEGNAGSTESSNTSYPGNTSSSGLGGNANLGYKFMQFFAIEMGYTLYANTSIKNNVGTKAATVKVYSYDLAAKGILPIASSGLEAFAKVGGQRLNETTSINSSPTAVAMGVTSGSHNATGLYLAGGLQYYFMPELAVNVQWARAEGNNTTGNYDLLSGGVSFIFD